MTDDELIAEWLKTNTPKRSTEAEPIYEPYSGKPMPTNLLTKVKLDPKSKKRIYQFLNKTSLTGSLDESTRNYGN